ncbi:hypothetical protein SU69_06905 [Thermosipho melanesiensis]|uniref:Membrane-bound metal-dependent hydrolase n=2 Tax=Thermosipho melanesiensis TaxID=46541 RepID=A6LMR0_THEM4|nr:metal-dependent hydrolase [Thermosipho melanesiensis]ABR31211.1 hypothetical protein Tmel_1364 [Thermosipho melanesiensis BI429]APT74295.1 hypothetical protein BW47_07230 [Thermosipho melanesiensis]OOC36236.1 hypothetical protein SU68_06975 [Thermosipho melanesiensis]OOC37054.1 hypothetical protein SU69_06905 [Thermosipho melanesiensis]OOC37806.1 hypothetical protein SU70_06915 [Thermosipho melanesiensis]
MPNFNSHVRAGVFFYPIVLYIYLFIIRLVNFGMPSEKIIAWGFFIFVLSSDMPDIDHNHSLLHKFVKLLVVSSVVYFEFTRKVIVTFFDLQIGVYLRFLISLLVGLFSGVLYEILIPRHRGPLHTIWAALIYGGIIFSGVYYFGFQLENAIFLGIISTAGYILHLLMDIFLVEKNGRLMKR